MASGNTHDDETFWGTQKFQNPRRRNIPVTTKRFTGFAETRDGETFQKRSQFWQTLHPAGPFSRNGVQLPPAPILEKRFAVAEVVKSCRNNSEIKKRGNYLALLPTYHLLQLLPPTFIFTPTTLAQQSPSPARLDNYLRNGWKCFLPEVGKILSKYLQEEFPNLDRKI